VAPGRFELPTSGLGNRCSIHLSYGATGANSSVYTILLQLLGLAEATFLGV
jgi:hypothetical protein